jgi:N utilization substance protein B
LPRRIGARRIALEVLFESELSKNDPDEILQRYKGQKAAEYAATLIQGVVEKIKQLDEVIDTHSTDWAIDRMPVVDRTLLRLGAFELLHEPDVPSAVVINEAVELAKEFSTDDSGRFINGVLASIARAFRKTSDLIVDSGDEVG